MHTVVPTSGASALAPVNDILAAVRARHGEAPVHGVTPGITIGATPAGPGWIPATRFTDGTAIDALLTSARRRWPAEPHVAAALAWKSYAYWAALPAVLGYASARRVPDMTANNAYVWIHGEPPFVEMALGRPDVTALATDPLGSAPVAAPADGTVRLVATEAQLLTALRVALLDQHLALVIDAIRKRVNIGRRTLLGSVASAVCYALLRASDVLPGSAVSTADAILDALGVADLVTFGPDGTGRLRVQRHTCCLAFALPVPRICSGCCIPG